MQIRYLAISHRSLIAAVAIATAAHAQGTAIVRGRVTLGDTRPMAGATVVAEDSLRAQTTARTGSDGRFQMRVKAPGSYQLAVVRVGTSPAIGPKFEVIPEDTIDADLKIPVTASDTAVALDSVKIFADRFARGDRLAEFEQRRLMKVATISYTRADIEKRNPISTWQMFTNISSVKTADMGGMVVARSTRNETPLGIMRGENRPCFMRVIVDEALMPEEQVGGQIATNLAHLPPPSDIHGIEVFAGPASIPARYGGLGSGKWCGLIVIWTR